MNGLTPIPVEKCLQKLSNETTGTHSPMRRHFLLSLAHWLKDARRWQYLKQHDLPVNSAFTPDELEKWVDHELGIQ